MPKRHEGTKVPKASDFAAFANYFCVLCVKCIYIQALFLCRTCPCSQSKIVNLKSTITMIRRIFVIAFLILQACQSPEQRLRPVDGVQNYLNQRLDSLHYFADQLRLNVLENNIPSAKNSFIYSRYQYKKIESIVEFYFPGVAKAINGPAIDKADEYDDKVIEASGFQVVEEQLYSADIDTVSLINEIDILRSTLTRIQKLFESNQLSDSNIMEACRLQIIRILSLGISGFDSPVALNSIPEAFSCARGRKIYFVFL